MKNSKAGRKTLIAGLILTITGLLLLFWTQHFVQQLVRWWPSVFMLCGVAFLYHYVAHKARPVFLLLGLLLFLTGTFILLLNTLLARVFELKQLWPVFMGIVGAAIIPYSRGFKRSLRISFVIPGIFLIIFMIVLLVFTLPVVHITFTDFVLAWWPILLVIMGITLIASYYFRDRGRSEQ